MHRKEEREAKKKLEKIGKNAYGGRKMGYVNLEKRNEERRRKIA